MNDHNAAGRPLYEADVARIANYSDGTPRKTWEQLDDIARWSWGRRVSLEMSPPDDPMCRLCGALRSAHTTSAAEWRTVPGCSGEDQWRKQP